MYKAPKTKNSRRGLRRLAVVSAVLLVVVVAAMFIVRHVYFENLRPISTSNEVKIVTIASGTSTAEIGKQLQVDGLIRSATVFEWYVHTTNLRDVLQAGTYALKPDMSVQQIVSTLVQGKIATNLVTILPGQRLDQVRTTLIKAGFTAAEVDDALMPQHYANAIALADKPASANLEGFLYPDSFQKDANTSPMTIVNESLVEMGNHLTPSIRAAFTREGLTTYQGITLASIVEQEVSNQSDRAQAAQVFLTRLKSNMSLGSDVTAYYGAIIAGQKPITTYDSPYNTLLHKGLPPGPISNVSDSSLDAVAHPAKTDWLYFVTGDNGKTYFSKTAEEHDALTKQYCHKLCSGT
jgi:UPF0755 protein